jgi:hypothetical protein
MMVRFRPVRGNDVTRALQEDYGGNAISIGNKSVKIAGASGRLSADVVKRSGTDATKVNRTSGYSSRETRHPFEG